MLGIHLGKRVGSVGQSLSTYWATREPSNASAIITGATTATVTWTDSVVPGADGYKVYAGATLKATVGVSVQTASITGLTADTEYVFKVVAYKGSNESTGVTDTKTTFITEFSDVYGQMTNKPGADLSSIFNTHLKTLVNGGVLSELEYYNIKLTHTNDNQEAQINWVTPLSKNTKTGTLTFNPFCGFKGNGTDDKLS